MLDQSLRLSPGMFISVVSTPVDPIRKSRNDSLFKWPYNGRRGLKPKPNKQPNVYGLGVSSGTKPKLYILLLNMTCWLPLPQTIIFLNDFQHEARFSHSRRVYKAQTRCKPKTTNTIPHAFLSKKLVLFMSRTSHIFIFTQSAIFIARTLSFIPYFVSLWCPCSIEKFK